MKVSELYAPHGPFVGQRIYVVGTGSSMSVFPQRVLKDKTCILLNDATRYFPQLGPIAFANNKKQLKFPSTRLTYKIVKGRLRFDPNPERTDNHVPWNDPDHYVFSYREPQVVDRDGNHVTTGDTISHLDERSLWKEPDYYFNVRGGSVAIFAVQFAILAGAAEIYLVGCDCTEISGEHYTSGKKNHQSYHDYAQYATGLLRVGQEAYKRGIPLVSLTPFYGLGYHNYQYGELRRWRNL